MPLIGWILFTIIFWFKFEQSLKLAVMSQYSQSWIWFYLIFLTLVFFNRKLSLSLDWHAQVINTQLNGSTFMLVILIGQITLHIKGLQVQSTLEVGGSTGLPGWEPEVVY